jgi:hypothetical protein
MRNERFQLRIKGQLETRRKVKGKEKKRKRTGTGMKITKNWPRGQNAARSEKGVGRGKNGHYNGV